MFGEKLANKITPARSAASSLEGAACSFEAVTPLNRSKMLHLMVVISANSLAATLLYLHRLTRKFHSIEVENVHLLMGCTHIPKVLMIFPLYSSCSSHSNHVF